MILEKLINPEEPGSIYLLNLVKSFKRLKKSEIINIDKKAETPTSGDLKFDFLSRLNITNTKICVWVEFDAHKNTGTCNWLEINYKKHCVSDALAFTLKLESIKMSVQ